MRFVFSPIASDAKATVKEAAAAITAQAGDASRRPVWTESSTKNAAMRCLELLQKPEPLTETENQALKHSLRAIQYGLCNRDELYQAAVKEAEHQLKHHPLPPSNFLSKAAPIETENLDAEKKLALQNATRKKIIVMKIYGQMVAASSVTGLLNAAEAIASAQNDTLGNGRITRITPQMMQPNSPFQRRLQMLGITMNSNGSVNASLLASQNEEAAQHLAADNRQARLEALETTGNMELSTVGTQYEGGKSSNHYEALGIPTEASPRGIEIAERRQAILLRESVLEATESTALRNPEATMRSLDTAYRQKAEAASTLEHDVFRRDFDSRSGHEHDRAEIFNPFHIKPTPPASVGA